MDALSRLIGRISFALGAEGLKLGLGINLMSDCWTDVGDVGSLLFKRCCESKMR